MKSTDKRGMRCALWIAWVLLGWLNQSPLGQPANDFFTNRIVLTGTNRVIRGSTFGGSTEPGEDTSNGGGVATVLYLWATPAKGFLPLPGRGPPPPQQLTLSGFCRHLPSTPRPRL